MKKQHEAIRRYNQENVLLSLGFTTQEADQLRRISNTLRRWYELECGVDGGCIERDEVTNIPYFINTHSMRRFRTPDREVGALKRLYKIMSNKPSLSYYLQTDPRGASLYILRPGDIPEGCGKDSWYTNGICIY